ncbi:MAG TPA: hypothetical protein VGF28_22810 [Thermoanaerobaculia bacterium]|jgi:hypothetical protein
MRKTLLVLSLLVAPALFAQTADLRLTRSNLSATPEFTGQPFNLSLAWRNDGPNAARFVTLKIVATPTPFFLQSVATSGWPCYPTPDHTSFSCQNLQLDAGAEAEVVVRGVTPGTPGPFTIAVQVTAEQHDPQPANNSWQMTMQLEAARSVDVSLTPTAQTVITTAGAQTSLPLNVVNGGTHAIANAVVYLSVPVTTHLPVILPEGAGWACGSSPYTPQAVLCTRARLEVGESAPLTVRTVATPVDGSFTITARVGGEGYSDPFTGNDTATLTVQVGTDDEEEPPPPPVQWSQILIPLIGADARGQNNSLWRTEVTALIASDTQVDVRPYFCELAPSCSMLQTPLRRPFNAYQQIAGILPGALGQFIYVAPADESRLYLNARVYDVSRSEQTAGAEIPIVRARDFRSTVVSLVGIPVAPHYRQTLRVYDLDGRAGGQVAIHVYADDETTPRTSVVSTLTHPAGAHATIQGRPTHPAVLQLDLAHIALLGDAETVRVDVVPIGEGLRLWSFVSVTNNETHHVTTFSQR